MSKPKTVTHILEARIAAGDLERDPAQSVAASALDDLLVRLGESAPRWELFSRAPEPVKGLYLWGGVGRGKSMLMDIFFDLAPVKAKRRVHFHAFMLEIHERISKERSLRQGEPIEHIAKNLANEASLICFDEFHVTDITDAMILSRLFEQLFARGITMLATSNRAPEDLYKNGLNRGLFEPFIDLLQSQCHVVEFPGATDHRLSQIQAAPVYYSPLDEHAAAKIEAVWRRLIGGAAPRETRLTVQGRELKLKRTAAGVARASFSRLCENPLGAADYLRLSKAFQTLILENVPQMGAESRNEAKRFVTLIDALYETRTKLVMSAAAEPDALYIDGDGAFEFARTASRLYEMRGEAYLSQRRNLDANGQ
ncbi:cell division protein ZapE [Robiginitomaculum antarcticum]|uniref:cell division protein ZapE n=1 Tax=Robiginitomaculum antarcticum TaxID=437507 RepID=UPI000364CE4E|nr:cell division protein ZapE [Robiginitomaculum antarcticum]